MYKKNGSITVFLSLIIVIVVSLIGGLVDGARMRTADAQVNRAVQNGLESALASYNKPLKQRYELFAYDEGDGGLEEEVKNIAMMNLVPDKSSGDYTDLYNYNIDSLGLKSSVPLQQSEVLEDQILQAMKYRAPINLIEGFIEKLGVFKDMGKYKKTIQQKEKLDQKMKKIDESVGKLQEKGEDTNKSITDVKNNKNTSQFGKLREEMNQFKERAKNAKDEIEKARGEYDNYKKSLDEIPEGVDQSTEVDKGNIKKGFNKESKSYDSIFNTKEDEGINKNLNIIKENEKIMKEIEDELQRLDKQDKDLDEWWRNIKEPQSPTRGDNESDEDYAKSQENYSREKDSYNELKDKYTREKDEIRKKKDAANARVSEIQELSKDKIENPDQDVDEDKTEDEIQKNKDGASDLKGKDGNEKVEEPKTQNGKDISKYMGSLPSKSTSTESFEFKLKNASSDENSSLNKSLDSIDYLDKINTTLTGLRNALYINEYIMTKFKDRAVGADGSTEQKFRVPMMVKDDKTVLDYEVEYIISGNPTDDKNGTMNWWKIYAMRMLVNSISIRNIPACQKTIEEMALVTATVLAFFGIPANYTLLKAIYTGAWVAFESKCDMDLLLKAHKVPLIKKDKEWNTWKVVIDDKDVYSKYDKVKPGKDSLLSTIYSDYLRLFLLIENPEKKLGRIKDLIELNMQQHDSNFKLKNQNTVIEVTGNASIKYLFFNLEFMDPKVRKTGRYNIPIKQSIAF